MSMTIEELAAREEIRQCVLRHFRAADRVDAELEREAFWPDGHFVGGPVHGPMAEAIGPLFREMLPQAFETTCHYIANLLLTVEGDRGFVEACGVGYHLIADSPEAAAAVLGEAKLKELNYHPDRRYELLVGVRYAITLERRDGTWKILTMAPVIDWSRAQPYAGIVHGGLPDAISGRGRRDREDPTYFGRGWKP